MRRAHTEFIRWVAVAVLCLATGYVAWKTAPALPSSWGCAALSALGDVSAVLFGVFGIWLGMFYRPDICGARNGRSGEDLANTCRQIVSNAKRFDVVFRGMKTSAAVLVFSMAARSFKAPLLEFLTDEAARRCVKLVVVYGIYWAVLLQSYAVITAIVPMLDAKRRMNQAREDAEYTLSL